MYKQAAVKILTIATAFAASASLAQAAAPITVTVNGTPISFSGTPPMETKGAVLVPLRGVFQALNASVNYNAAARTVFAQKGSASVVLPLGSSTATVNGQTETLSQPAQTVNGTTLVPLRFVAQALGAYVQWNAATSTVAIKTVGPHLASLPAPTGTGPVTGQVTGVYADSVPQTITVRVNGQNNAVPLTPQTIILRSQVGQPAVEVPLSQITPGDEVHIQRGPHGNALSITATFGEIVGTVKVISQLPDGSSVITLNDGKAIELTPNAPITMDGRKMALADVLPNEKIVVRTNPNNSLGYGVAVATGGNQVPIPPGTTPASAHVQEVGVPTVTSFTQDAIKPLRAGDVLTATLTGTPGGQASFSIPGVVGNVPMKEGPSGVYTGAYTVPKNMTVTGAAVIGKLTVNGVASPLIQAGQTVTLDSAPPTVTDVSPGRGATVENDRPLIYATVTDGAGVGINPNATHLLLDGTDVTSLATVTPAFVSLKPAAPLAPGAHSVRLTIADAAGNTATTQWTFNISTQRIIQSFTSSAPSGALSAGTLLRFRLVATPGGTANVRLQNIGRVIHLTETRPGIYTGQYTVQPGDNATRIPAVATFVAANGTQVTAPLKNDLSLSGGAPAAPTITFPASDALVSDPLTVSGTAAPGATVEVTVSFSGKALGGLVPLTGTVASKEVTADASGDWSASHLSLRANSLFGEGSNTTFTITAITVDSAGETSPVTTVNVRRR